MNYLRVFWVGTWRAERRWLLLRLVCALLWAAEWYCVQEAAFEVVPWIRHPFLVQTFRFGLDLLVTLALVLLLRRRWLAPLLLFNLAAFAMAGTYSMYFHWPMMPVRLLSQWNEGWSMRSTMFGLLSWQVLALASASFALKSWLLARSGSYCAPPRVRWRAAVVALLLYSLPIAALQGTTLRLTVSPNGALGRTVFVYGYVLPWACDLVSNRDIGEHSTRAYAYLAHEYDRITPLELPLPAPRHLITLQMESVDAMAIEATNFQGRLIMPFLHDLQSRSMFFRIRSFARTGSCDMDFAAATCTEPYPAMVPYRLLIPDYTNSMPGFMKRHGYSTYAFHGNTALFYERGAVFERLGFDRLFFKEQLLKEPLATSVAGVRDADVLRRMNQAIQTEHHAYLLGITLDTHTPFRQLDSQEMEIFPRPTDALERYFNALKYLDNCLRDFITRLPDGSMVVLYGDHPAPVRASRFDPDIVDGVPYVGCLVFEKGNDLSGSQKTRNMTLATDGLLNLLDILNYVRHSIEAADMPSRSVQPTVSANKIKTLGAMRE